MKKAVILGATGFVGSYVLQELLKNNAYDEITVYTRKQIAFNSDKVKQIVTDFSDLGSIELPEKVDSLFACLGTTRKKTPDLKKYHFIEVEIPQFFVEQLKPRGLKSVQFISAIGANSNANNFYLKLKGQAEDMFKAQNLEHLSIYQPGFLMGKRPNAPLSEKIILKIVQLLDVLCVGKGAKYHSVKADFLAETMVFFDEYSQKGTFTLTYGDFRTK